MALDVTRRCSVPGCSGYWWASGMCSRHYERFRRTGSVEDGPKARKPLAERFWKQVDRRAPDECWPWTAKSRITGYGVIGRGGRDEGKVLSHRCAWELTNGPIPEGEGHHGTVVMHTCDNRLCCNPAHLRLGSQAENVRDMDAKERRVSVPRYGERHHKARLTTAQVEIVRTSPKSAVELAREFGCHRNRIYDIRNGKWRQRG